ncbi:MAG: IS110 family transposase [Candidatus Acidiferrales bacterium]
MTIEQSTSEAVVWVAIDVAKDRHETLIEAPGWRSRKKFRVQNTAEEFRSFAAFLHSLNLPVRVGFEPTGNYHRALAYFLHSEGFQLELISSLALARTREAMHNSWDKNDPKDAQVILHLLKARLTQHYHDPMVHNLNDLQELSKTHHHVSLEKTRTQHRLLTHYLPLYFPEIARYHSSSRSEWLWKLLIEFPTPRSITRLSRDEFVRKAWSLVGRKVSKERILTDVYLTAQVSVGLPAEENSETVAMLRFVLRQLITLCQLRDTIENRADALLQNNADYQRLRRIPGIGPISALTILAEAGDLRRFSHHRQFLKFCGFDLATEQSGQFRGLSRLSKRGNARLRAVFWMAASVAVRMRENSFRAKFERYMRSDPGSADRKRKAYVAVAAKIARVAYALIRSGADYRCFHEVAVPSGRTHSARAVEAIPTS